MQFQSHALQSPLKSMLRRSRFVSCSCIVLPSGSLLSGQSPQAPLAGEASASEAWISRVAQVLRGRLMEDSQQSMLACVTRTGLTPCQHTNELWAPKFSPSPIWQGS